MPLGRFAAYFLLLMTVGLVAFPRAVGTPPDAPDVCVGAADGSVTCDAPGWRPHSLRHSARARRHRPASLLRLEAGPAGLPARILGDVGRATHPLDA